MSCAKSHVFFLGGHDAEMLEIRNIIESRGLLFHDLGLSWGAAVSSYDREIRSLSGGVVPVFIELEPDRVLPENAVVIDHHGEGAGQGFKTSLEQVADLLGVELDRRQRLISANDRGHVPAMRGMGASDEEIAAIRRLDRQAQGVTARDERLAGESIAGRSEIVPEFGAIFVNSLTERVSAVTDRISDRYRHIIVMVPSGGLFYFGTGDMVRCLVNRYKTEVAKVGTREFWFGGDLPAAGYFGARQALSKEEIKKMLPGKIFSHHIFMFPFTIDPGRVTGDILEVVPKKLLEHVWEEKSLDPTAGHLDYNEYYYFHSYVREPWFGLDSATGTETGYPLCKCLTMKTGPEARFIIKSLKRSSPYILELERVGLRIFDTEIGILSFELVNRQYDDIEDIITINDMGRRIYPQFLGSGPDATPAKNTFLPDRVELIFDNEKLPKSEESFHAADFNKKNLVVAKYIRDLLGEKIFTTDPNGNIPFKYRPTIDDRMFVVCWYGSDKWSGYLAEKAKKDDKTCHEYTYENDDTWYRFIFFDQGFKNCRHFQMTARLIKQATYERWTEWGTLFGISRYGLVCISPQNDPDNPNFCFGYDVLRYHMGRQYAQMAGILLAQRASILKFSDTVSRLSGKIKGLQASKRKTLDQKELKTISNGVIDLQASYIRFVNRLWFTEVTPQEQGIELYRQAMKIMDLPCCMDELKAEIKELYEFVSLTHDRSENTRIKWLAVLGGLFLPLTLVTGFFGINLYFMDSGLARFFGQTDGLMDLLVYGISIFVFILISFVVWSLTKGFIILMSEEELEIQEYLTWNSLRKAARAIIGDYKKRGSRGK